MKLLRKPITKTVSILLSFIMIMGLFSVIPPSAFAASGVNYIYRSWDGEKVVEEVRTCTSYTSMDSNSLTLSSGWYVVENSMDLSHARIMVNGDVNLILCDGATLTDNKGINVDPESSLSIYGQSGDTGKLCIHARYHEDPDAGNNAALIGGTYDAGNISIYGGTIDLVTGFNNEERYHGAGIGGGKNGSPKQIKIYGGFIKCDTEGNDSACIGGGSGAMASSYDGEGIVIYGGELDLRSSYGAAIGNGKNCTGSTGSIGIYGGTITAESAIGAGIGGGENGGNGPVNIYGGYVTAVSTARECGAGIGGGASASQNAPIRILGGTVVASAKKGAGIGGGKESNGGEIEIAHANVISSSSGGGAGIGGGIKGSSSNVHIHSDAVVCSISTTTKSHQAFADLLNMCVGDAKMKGDASTYGQASVCALSLLIDWFDPEFSGCAIGGGNEGSGGTITIEDSRVYAYCGKRAAVIGGGQNKGFDSITISGSEVFARNKPFEDDEDVLSNLENETKDRIKKVIDGVDGAAIGTGDEAESGGGTITIKNHSDVTAIAGTDAAGIGTGDESDVTCTINISDSKVEAHGGRYGAGIGGGDGTDSGNITINASDITVDSATDGAGIGGGESGKSNTITITDSTVTARGGGYAAGIGGGDHADGGTTIISRSTVRAYGGTDAAGIGGGEDGDGGHIEIYDSDVYAKGKGYGAGIGAGEDSSGDYCSIFGDSRVEAVSGGDGNVQSIGHGDCGWYVSYTGGTLSLDSHLIVNAGSSANDTSEYLGSSRYNAIWGNKYALIRPCGHPDTGWRYMNQASPYHVKYCKKCGRALGEYEEHIWDEDHVCTVCHASAEMHTTTYIEQNNSGEVQKEITAPSFTEYEAPECTNTPDGYEFVCWCLNNDIYFEPGDLRNLNYFDMTVKAVYMPAVEATYIDENGVEQTVTARRIYDTDYKLYLTEGWYIVDSNINLDGGIRYTGDVKLIIADGKTLSFTRYSVSGQDPNSNAFWAVDEDYKPSKVTVYGQTQQTGVLDIGARYPYFYDFTINGGTVKLKDEDYPDQGVIGVYKTCTVNRGTLTADRIFCDHLVLNGGNVDITHAHSFTESLLGWKKQSDSFVLGYYGNNLQIADGQAFTDENGNIYEGSLTTEQIESLQVKTLTPYIAHDYADPEWIWDNEYTDAKAVFRCRDCDDVQTVRAKVTYSDDSNIRTSEAKCEFLGETFTATHEGKIVFDISITPSEHGTVTVKRAQEKPGENVDLIVEPEEGYVSKLLTVTDSDHHEVPMSGDSFIMPESDVTVSAAFIRDKVYHSRIEPYIDENGAYVFGEKEYFEYDGKSYAVNEDGSLGEELSDISLSYFEFKLNGETYQINRYTGPAINGKLIIPKTFNGKKITVLGNDEQENLYNRDKTQFELVLNENITEIKPYTFYLLYVTKLSGDTSGLSKLGKYAFSWANSPGGYKLDIKLDYPGMITAGYEMFNNMYVTARVKHATTFSSSQLSAKKIDYIFTDNHTYGNPIWTWSDDNSAATVAFTCTDTRCNHQETVDATITRGEAVEGKVLLTASVEVNGTTYTNEKEVFADSMGARLVGHSISLDGDIAVNFYMELSDSVIAHKDTAYMHFTIPAGSGTTEQKMLVKDALIKEWNGKDYYVFKCRVAAKEITSQIKAQMIDGDLNGTEYTYSVKEYADYLIEHAEEREDLAAAVPLVKKMLNYGSYAQLYFDKNPGALANADLTDNEKALGTPEINIAAPDESKLSAGVTFEGATLSLKSETSLSLYFKSSDTLEFSCDGYTVEKATSGGYQIARIRGIKAKHIGDILTLKINGSEAISYSPLNYCKNVLDGDTTDEKLQNVVKALYLYWQAADVYFKS